MRYLAVQWEDDRLQVASAQIENGRINVDRAFQVDSPHSTDDEKSAGEFLASQLAEHSVPKGDVIAVIGRGQVEMRQFEVPMAPDEELPDIVRFQAKNQFAAMSDDWTVDFVKIQGKDTDRLTVLACAASPELLEQIQNALEHAKLKAKHVVLRPFAVVDLLASKIMDGPCQIIVDRHGDEVDLTVTCSDHIVLTRTVKIPTTYGDGEIAKSITREIRRSIASAQNQTGGQRIKNAIICGADEQYPGLRIEIEKDLDVSVEFIPPFSLVKTGKRVAKSVPEGALGFSSVLGSLVEQAGIGHHTIDFLNPRRRPERQIDRNRQYIYAGIGTAIAVVLLIGCYWMLSSRASEIKRLKNDLAFLEGGGKRDAALKTIRRVEAVDDWKKGDVNWLDEMYEISDRFPSPDDAIVTYFSGHVRKTPFDASISLKGKTSGMKVENAMNNALRERPYETNHGASPRLTDDPNFERVFSQDLTLDIASRDVEDILAQEAGGQEQEPETETSENSNSPK